MHPVWFVVIGFALALELIVLALHEKEIHSLMADLSKLEAASAALSAVIPNLVADYKTLKDAIDALKVTVAGLQGQIDPNLQTKIDAVADAFAASNQALANLDATV